MPIQSMQMDSAVRATLPEVPSAIKPVVRARQSGPAGLSSLSGPSSVSMRRRTESEFSSEASVATRQVADRPRLNDPSTADRRASLECMRVFAQQAHQGGVTEVATLKPMAGASTDVMKLWQGEQPDAIKVVVGFAATRDGDKGDMCRNFQSLLPLSHANPMDEAQPSLGAIGGGLQKRWERQAKVRLQGNRSLPDVLIESAAQAKAQGKPLHVNVVGHSLGAAVATVAGYDIANFLQSKGVPGHTEIFAFSPPRMGSAQAAQRYQTALLASRQKGSVAAPQHSLQLHQFTRTYDAVQSAPLFMHHPIWHDPSGLPGDGRKNPELVKLARQDNINVPARAGPLDLAANHAIEPWSSSFTTDIPSARIDGMLQHTLSRQAQPE